MFAFYFERTSSTSGRPRPSCRHGLNDDTRVEDIEERPRGRRRITQHAILAPRFYNCDWGRMHFSWAYYDVTYCDQEAFTVVAMKCFCVLMMQSVGYYYAHKTMHQKSFYW